jgi:osmotically-inducible protein OsmY
MRPTKMIGTLAIAVCALGVGVASSSWAASRATDDDIAFWVKNALRQDQRVDASEITVSTSDGIVTLDGTVDTLAAKEFADRETKKINGVLGVVNQIEVSPTWRSDVDIRMSVQRRILNSAVIDSQSISVSSVNGKVTLSGEVASWSERDEAGLLARGVRGVREVVNDLTMSWDSNRSDNEIKNDVVAALDRDVYTNGLPITVTVDDGVVTLTGSVGNAYEKDRAGDTVRWIANVHDVVNLLDVEWLENRGVRARNTTPSSSDLRTAVRDELDHDWRLDPSDVNVKVSGGHVVLDGSVYSHYERRVAAQDAQDVVGVEWVTNNLFARTDTREDPLIRKDVQFDLDTDATVGDFGIASSVVDGIVTLEGDVHTWYQKAHAGELAAGVRGVKRVINDIDVARMDWRSDAELTEALQNGLKWNWTTWWVHDDIGVTVKNGVATLTGDVNKWSQRKASGEIAINTPGIWEVDNRITVKGYDYPWDEWHTKIAHHASSSDESHQWHRGDTVEYPLDDLWW